MTYLHRNRLTIVVCLALVTLTFAGFAPVCVRTAQFITIDDDEYVVDNPHVNSGASVANLRWALTAFHSNNWHPLTWASLQLDAQVYGLSAAGYHRTNVLIHALSAALLFLALKWMTGTLWRSALVAALFAWHPLHVESVAWIAERKDVLSGLFWMLTLLAYAAYVKHPRPVRYGVLLATYALGLGAKPMLVTLPCVLLLLDYWPLARWPTTPGLRFKGACRLVLEKLPLLALAAGASVLTVRAQAGVMKAMLGWPLGARLCNALLSYVAYLGKAIWPRNLSMFYPHPGTDVSIALTAAAGVFLVAVSTLVIWQRRRRPYLAVGWFWYVGTLVPVIGIVQVGLQGMADRYTYLPLIGLAIMVVWGGADLAAALRLPRPAVGVATAGMLLGCLFVTRAQSRYWLDGVTVLEHAEQAVAPSPTIEHCLGQALAKDQRDDEAERHFRRALRLDSHDMFAHEDLGVLLGREAMAGDTDALSAQRKLDEAVQHLRMAAQLHPDSANVHNYLGETLRVQAYCKRGDPRGSDEELRQAIEQFQMAISLAPESAPAYLNLGKAWLMRGDPAEALKYLHMSLERDSEPAEARQFLHLAEEMRRRMPR